MLAAPKKKEKKKRRGNQDTAQKLGWVSENTKDRDSVPARGPVYMYILYTSTSLIHVRKMTGRGNLF